MLFTLQHLGETISNIFDYRLKNISLFFLTSLFLKIKISEQLFQNHFFTALVIYVIGLK